MRPAWQPILALFVALAATATITGQAPVVQEQTLARVYSIRLLIRPTFAASPGRCLDVGIENLRVSLRGERIRDPAALELERDLRPTMHAILVDTSRSMGGWLQDVREAASGYIERMDPLRDRGFVIAFDEGVRLKHGSTRERGWLIRGVEGIRLGTGTSLHDAITVAAAELDVHSERPVMVVLSDGWDTTSLHDARDVYDLVRGREDLLLFAIGLAMPAMDAGRDDGVSLNRLAAMTGGRYFDAPTGSRLPKTYRRIREMLDSEAVLTVIDPEPALEPGRVRIRSSVGGCRIDILDSRAGDRADSTDDIATPVRPQEPIVIPELWERLYFNHATQHVDPACEIRDPEATHVVDELRSTWFTGWNGTGLHGCALDVTMDFGLLYNPEMQGHIERNTELGLKTRPFGIEDASIGAVAETPEAWLDALADQVLAVGGDDLETHFRRQPPAVHSRPYHDIPGLVHGRTFFMIRAALARAMYARPEQARFVRDRLQTESRERIAALERRLAWRAPDRPIEAIREAATESAEGRRILAVVDRPTDDDLIRHLAGWLGDISAHDLMVLWETRELTRLLSKPVRTPDDEDPFRERWSALFDVFGLPSYTRELTLLGPVLAADGPVGYWRVVLPRPGLLQRRMRGYRGPRDLVDIPLDLPPPLPLAYWTAGRLLEQSPDLARAVRIRAYRPTAIDYRLLGKPRTHGMGRAFERTEVQITLARAGSDREDDLVLRAELALADPRSKKERSARGERLPFLVSFETSGPDEIIRRRLSEAADRVILADAGGAHRVLLGKH